MGKYEDNINGSKGAVRTDNLTPLENSMEDESQNIDKTNEISQSEIGRKDKSQETDKTVDITPSGNTKKDEFRDIDKSIGITAPKNNKEDESEEFIRNNRTDHEIFSGNVMESGSDETQKKRNSFLKSLLKEVLFYAVVFILCVFIVPKYIVQKTIVDGYSMENTLNNGDHLLMEKFTYRFSDPDRFDVVVFHPHGKASNEYYVKRVIGLPGETIQIKGSDIYINGEILNENFGKDPISFAGIAGEPITLGEDEFFLMGDNREISLDSRYDDVGLVHRDLIAGHAFIRIWPLNKFGLFK